MFTTDFVVEGFHRAFKFTVERTNAHSQWRESGRCGLDQHNLCMLLANEIAFIRIPEFATREECEKLVIAASGHGFSSYRGVEPQINRIGNTVFEYHHISRDMYFERNAQATRIQEEIFAQSFNPLDRLMALFREQAGASVRIAARSDGARYYAGLIRRIESGTLLHIDFAPAEQRDWEVAAVTHQLSWNLYLRISNHNDGKTHIFERQWNRDDDGYREGSYGYSSIVAKGASKATFMPRAGEVVLFNTRNFHYVDPTAGERVTVTSALGMLPNGEIIFWS